MYYEICQELRAEKKECDGTCVLIPGLTKTQVFISTISVCAHLWCLNSSKTVIMISAGR